MTPDIDSITTIHLKKSTSERLKKYSHKDSTWDKLLNDLMDEVDNLNFATSDMARDLQNNRR